MSSSFAAVSVIENADNVPSTGAQEESSDDDVSRISSHQTSDNGQQTGIL